MNHKIFASNILSRLFLITLLSTPSSILPMTLNELPQEVRENILEKLVANSKDAQEARHELAKTKLISRTWRFSQVELHAYEKYKQAQNKKISAQKNYISQAFEQRKENAKKELLHIINQLHQLTPEQYQVLYQISKPAALFDVAHNNFDWLVASKILDPLMQTYMRDGALSLDCFDAFFALYNIHQNTTTTDPMHRNDFVLFKYISKNLITEYLTFHYLDERVRKIRAQELIMLLHTYGLFYPVDLHDNDVWTNNIKIFIQRPDASAEDIVFLNKTIHLKKLLQYDWIKNSRAEYKRSNRYFNLKSVCVCTLLAISISTAIYKWPSIFTESTPETQEAIAKILLILYSPLLYKTFIPPWLIIQSYKTYKKSDRCAILQHLQNNELFAVKKI